MLISFVSACGCEALRFGVAIDYFSVAKVPMIVWPGTAFLLEEAMCFRLYYAIWLMPELQYAINGSSKGVDERLFSPNKS